MKCYNCNRFGHLSKNCRSKKSFSSAFKSKNPKKGAFIAFHSIKSNNNSEWFIDSRASTHMTNDIKLLKDIREDQQSTITTANDKELLSNTIDKTDLNLTVNNEVTQIEARDVLYVPVITANLLSISQMVKNHHIVLFDSNGYRTMDKKGNLLATATEKEGIYKLDQIKKSYIANISDDHTLWHKR